jgi:cytochrome c peroxidase
MKKKWVALIALFFLLTVFILLSFQSTDSFFQISKKDVELVIPKGFPKPIYNFSNNRTTPEIFTLGRKLFYDPIMSLDSFTSCGSCHQQYAAFAHIDHKLSHGVSGKIGKRNVPAIQNMIWQPLFMADGGINHMDLQPIAPITSATEMGETLAQVIAKLSRSNHYKIDFYRAYHDSTITTERIMKSLSQFVGLMISSNSKYDKVKKHQEKFTADEMEGYKTFKSKCESCHQEPLFTDNSFRNIGLPPDKTIDDQGRALITGKQEDEYKFKVPSLRNVETTYPYMHDGRFKNQKEVLNHYSMGNYFGNTFDKNLEKTVALSESEKVKLIAFLKTLTDPTFLRDRRFADPSFVRR